MSVDLFRQHEFEWIVCLFACLCVHIYVLSKKFFLINQRGGTISRPEIAYEFKKTNQVEDSGKESRIYWNG